MTAECSKALKRYEILISILIKVVMLASPNVLLTRISQKHAGLKMSMMRSQSPVCCYKHG